MQENLGDVHQARRSYPDIGAGAGALAVPLASMGGHVTAVEPSGPMRGALVRYAQESGDPLLPSPLPG